MKVVIAGGTGFLGSPLAEVYAEEGHDVRVLTRSLEPGQSRHESGTGVPGITRVGWAPNGQSGPWAAVLDGATAVINLAGEPVAARRWTPQRKAQLRDSRVLPTRSLAAAIRASAAPPSVFVSGSAVGYYGPSADDVKAEDSGPGHDFLAHLCEDWEQEARRVEAAPLRIVLLRTGLVLERTGGVLAKMMTPFRFFAGGRLGSGCQYMSWIHRLDWVEMVRWLVETPAASGPFNATAPHPVTNVEFAKALGRALHRPALMRTPSFALKLLLGEMAESLVTGQRVVPARPLSLGFHFRYPEIDIAMRGIFGE
jgi:uncharacterized protein (TIGR01777 family)